MVGNINNPPLILRWQYSVQTSEQDVMRLELYLRRFVHVHGFSPEMIFGRPPGSAPYPRPAVAPQPLGRIQERRVRRQEYQLGEMKDFRISKDEQVWR